MKTSNQIQGVFAAAVTPLNPDLSPDFDGMIHLLQFLANRGCHGVLLMGTTGEGPSCSLDERVSIFRAAISAHQYYPDLRFLAGTGTPSLEDTITLTKAAFDLGYDGVVVLPPYYFRKVSDEGLFSWFSQVIRKAVPSDGSLLGYHIPPVTGLGFSLDLITKLKDSHPRQFIGIKDSSGDPDWAQTLGHRFGNDLIVLNGNDRLFSLALKSKASGCITAMANLISPLHRIVWDNFQVGITDDTTQGKLSGARQVFDRYPPMPPLIKLMLSRLHNFPSWKVKPPLLDTDPILMDRILFEFTSEID